MINFYVNLMLLITLLLGFLYTLFKIKTFKLNSFFIVASLLVFWIVMYMQKSSPEVSGRIKQDFGGWVWPIIAGLYQLMQVATRVPYGKLSQKLGSRKKIVQCSFFFVLVAMTMMIATDMSTWSMIVAAIAMGQYGATFGLDSQYISENHNIKKVFISSSIAFVIPVIGSLFASTIYGGFSFANNLGDVEYYWIIFAGLMIGFVGFFAYTLWVKEDTSTIFLDNVDPQAKVFVQRNMKDVWAVSLTAALMAFAHNFAIGFASRAGVESYWISILSVISLTGSVLIGMVLKGKVNGRFIRTTSLSFMLASLVMAALLFMTGDMTKVAFILLLAISSLSFGMYVMALFGAALHFDHKYPALVLGIFLSVKSFTLGTSTISSGEILVATHSNMTIGIVILAVSVVFISASLLVSMFVVNRIRDNDMDKLIDDSFKYELDSSKLVVSK